MEWTVEELDGCTSTMDEARRRAREGAPEGTVVVAQRMEDGRGTHGRPWHAPEGGLYMSFVLRGDMDLQHLTLALGNAVADVLETAGADARLKWVNDVVVDGRKVAGILVEAESTGDRIDFVVGGIGINVNGRAADWPHPLQKQAVTLEDVLGVDSCLPDLQAYLLDALRGWLHRLQTGDVGGIVAAWRARDALAGTRIGFDPDGDLCSKLVGTARGIDEQGRLLVDVDGEVQAFRSGHVVPMH